MTNITLTINGSRVAADIEPRTHLADFLRGHRNLTGTHLGCEQGVCGACTVLIDGKPQRSCLTFAVDCDGAEVRSIEGFDDDPLMSDLREAFSAHHALQCGFCTPGMLASARDIVSRLGEVSEARIREELAGNLCRCTGYVGIVGAIRSVSLGRQPQQRDAVAAVRVKPLAARPAEVIEAAAPIARTADRSAANGPAIEQRISIAAPADKVWEMLSDLRRVATCIPGTEITEIDGETIKGRVRLALGPIKPAFNGEARVQMNPATREGSMTGRGRDSGTGSAAEGEARWKVIQLAADETVVVVNLSWRLTGMLSQFNRSGIVQDVVRRLAAAFATNIEAMLRGEAAPAATAPSVNPFSLIWAAIKSWLFKAR